MPEPREDLDHDPVLAAVEELLRLREPDDPVPVLTKALIVGEGLGPDGERTFVWMGSDGLTRWDAEGLTRFYLRMMAAWETANAVCEEE